MIFLFEEMKFDHRRKTAVVCEGTRNLEDIISVLLNFIFQTSVFRYSSFFHFEFSATSVSLSTYSSVA
jgi:hypothetical protein